MKSHTPLFLFLCLLAPTTLAGEADAPTFAKAVYPDSIRFVTATSEDGEVMTMLFDNFVVSTRPGKGQHLGAETKSFSVANDLKAREGVTATLDVRGFVAVEEGGSAALLIHAGGETTIVDLSKAIEAAASKPRESEDALYAQAVQNATWMLTQAASIICSFWNSSTYHFTEKPDHTVTRRDSLNE